MYPVYTPAVARSPRATPWMRLNSVGPGEALDVTHLTPDGLGARKVRGPMYAYPSEITVRGMRIISKNPATLQQFVQSLGLPAVEMQGYAGSRAMYSGDIAGFRPHPGPMPRCPEGEYARQMGDSWYCGPAQCNPGYYPQPLGNTYGCYPPGQGPSEQEQAYFGRTIQGLNLPY